MTITSTTQLDERGYPQDPYAFGRAIERNQDENLDYSHGILFNKGRYFETSLYNKELLQNVSQLTGIPVQFNTMIVGSWKQMEDFVAAMNLSGYRVRIDIDWI